MNIDIRSGVGTSYRSVGALPTPFLLFDERITEIPAGSTLVNNSQFAFKIVLLLDGSFCQRIDGKVRFAYRAGDAAIFPGPCKQEFIPENPNRPQTLHAVRILFRGDVIARARAGQRPADSLESMLVKNCDGPRNLAGFLDATTNGFLRQLRCEAEGNLPERRQAVFGLLTTLAVSIIRSLQPNGTQEMASHLHRTASIVHRARSFMAAHYAQRLTLEEIAWNQKLSAEHLARVFRKSTGKTVFDHLETVRIDASKQLLIQPSPSIAKIAECCGFGSATWFGIRFKIHTGLTPSAYRSALGFTMEQSASKFRSIRP